MAGNFPRLPGHVVRMGDAGRYLDRWAAVTVVMGPQGFGKTTQVALWLRDLEDAPDVVWVSARHTDDWMARFRNEQTSESQTVDEDASLIGRESGRATTGQPDPIALLDDYATSLRDQSLVVVIDDAHELTDEGVQQALVDVVSRRHHVHLIVCTRHRIPLQRMAYDAVHTVVVPARSLLWRRSDIRALGNSLGARVSRTQAAELKSMFGGWPAPTRLVLEEVDDGMVHLPLTKGGDYLRDIALPGIADREWVARVGRLCLAERLTRGLIRDLAGAQDAAEVIARFEEVGLVERSYEADDVLYTLPPYVRAAFREAYLVEHSGQVGQTHRQLADWFAVHDGPGHRALALAHAVSADDSTMIDNIWKQYATELVLDHPFELFNTLQTLPESRLNSQPSLRVALETCRALHLDGPNRGHHSAALGAYAGTSRRIAARGLTRLNLQDLLWVGAGAVLALRLEGRLSTAEELGDQLEAAAETKMSEGAAPGDGLSWFYLQRGVGQALVGQDAAAKRHYHLAWQHNDHHTPHIAAHVAANLALLHSTAADLPQAQHWVTRHDEFDTPRSWAREHFGFGAHVARGIIALDRLEPNASRAALDQLDDCPALELWPFGAHLAAQHGLHYGSRETALADLDTALRVRPIATAHAAVPRRLLTVARAELLLAEGEAHRAHQLLTTELAQNSPTLSVPLARLHLMSDQPAEAIRVASTWLRRRSTDNRTRLSLLLLVALAHYRLRDLATSRTMMNRAVELYLHTGLLRPFATLPAAELESMLREAGAALPPPAAERLAEHDAPFPTQVTLIRLTNREEQLVRALQANASRQAIADEFVLSTNTVRNQVAGLYRKLSVKTRSEALARLAQLGIAPNKSESRPSNGDAHA